MINPHSVARLLTNYIAKLPPSTVHLSGYSAKDEDVAKQLYDNVTSILNSSEYRFENEHTLDFVYDLRYPPYSNDSDEEEAAEEDTDYDENDKAEDNLLHDFSLQYMKKAVSCYDEKDPNTGKRKHSWNSFHHSFKNVTGRKCLSRFRKYIAAHGTKKVKLDEIDSFTYNCFEKAREQLLSIHDIDLKLFALKKAREVGDNTFVAGHHWLCDFKRRHGICSRKITKLVTKSEVENKETIHQSADDFVVEVQKMLPKYKPENVINTDQSGLAFEMYSNRTLSFKGEHLTLAKVRSVHNTTHSYSVQPTISLSGHQIGPLLICLQEANGHMSDNIKRNLFKAKNVVITCSKSGKLTTSLVEYWVNNVLIPTIGNKKCLLLSDYWGGQRDVKLYQSLKHTTRLEIPKKTTSMIQPCDVYYNRQFKHIVRQMYDHVRLYELDVNLAQRNNIIKMNSLAYNQLSSPKFNSMIRYAWYQSGYMKQNPGTFENVKEICFSFDDSRCHIHRCKDFTPFIKCSYCSKVLCFKHFFEMYHFH
jgi:hypothetical protein